jgi:hypothetical protein
MKRMILRLHLVERMGIDAIGALCSVHRATAAQAIARAKETPRRSRSSRLIARWQVADTICPRSRGSWMARSI